MNSFCSHAIFERRPLVVSDALMDERFADNPHVTGDPGVRFYAGHPLILSNGCCVGTLCILDTKPRHLDDAGISLMGDLAQFAVREMEPSRPGVAEPSGKSMHGIDPRTTWRTDAYRSRSRCRATLSLVWASLAPGVPLMALSVVSLRCGIWSAIGVTADMAGLAAGSPLSRMTPKRTCVALLGRLFVAHPFWHGIVGAG